MGESLVQPKRKPGALIYPFDLEAAMGSIVRALQLRAPNQNGLTSLGLCDIAKEPLEVRRPRMDFCLRDLESPKIEERPISPWPSQRTGSSQTELRP